MRRYERVSVAPAATCAAPGPTGSPADASSYEFDVPRPRRPARCSPTPTARSPSNLAAPSSPRSGGRDDLSLCGAGRPVHRRIVMIARRVRASASLLRVVVVVVVADRGDRAVAAPARHPAGLGHRADRRRRSGGPPRSCSRSGSTTGTGAPTGSCCARSRSASRPRWRSRSPSTSWRGPDRSRSASAPVSSSRPARSARSRPGSRCSGATGSSSTSPGARASARSSPPRAAPSARRRPVGVRLRRVLEEAGGVYVKLGQIAATRVDLIPPDVSRRARRRCRTGSRRSRSRSSGPRSRPSSVDPSTTCSPSSTGSRSPPRRSARPTGHGCAPAKPSS